MAENLGKWPSKRGPISKIRPSDGCGRYAVPLVVERWYDFHDFGCRPGNVGVYMLIRELFRQISLAQSQFGKPAWRQLMEMAQLAVAPGRLRPSEYFDYGLFDDGRFTMADRRLFVGYKASARIDAKLNSKTSRILSLDKLVFYMALHGLGLPIPKIYAITHPSGRYCGLAKCCSSEEEILELLADQSIYPFFSKPIFGSFGRGAHSVLGYDPINRQLSLARGDHLPADVFCSEMLEIIVSRRKLLSGNIIQEALRPHRRIEALCGPNISGIRVVILMEDGKPRVTDAVWKITTGDNYVDNFSEGKLGNMIGRVDLDSGEVTRVQSGFGLDMRENPRHPDTSKVLVGNILPDWEDLLDICLKATSVAPELRFQHWDIALTDRGPVILELNVRGGLDIVQLAPQSGFYKTLHHSSCDMHHI